MAKIAFKMSKNEQYIECHRPFKLPNGKYSGMIRVYELLNPAKVNMLTTIDWSYQPEIVDPNATTGYNSLEIDGQLIDLEKLVEDLCKSRLRVNRQGNCYFQIMQGVADTTETYGFTFYRMNDVLKWSDYGVSMKLDKPDARMLWDRLDILHGSAVDAYEIHQKDNNYTVNDQQKTQNQILTDRVKELEAQLELFVPKHFSQYYVPATSPALLPIERKPNYPQTSFTMVQYWESFIDSYFGTYTPTCVTATTKGASYMRLSIQLKQDERFDTSNWYFVKVKEYSDSILVYEGTMHSINVAGHAMSSPVDGSAYINFGGQIFGPIIIVGVGHRIGLRPGRPL